MSYTYYNKEKAAKWTKESYKAAENELEHYSNRMNDPDITQEEYDRLYNIYDEKRTEIATTLPRIEFKDIKVGDECTVIKGRDYFGQWNDNAKNGLQIHKDVVVKIGRKYVHLQSGLKVEHKDGEFIDDTWSLMNVENGEWCRYVTDITKKGEAHARRGLGYYTIDELLDWEEQLQKSGYKNEKQTQYYIPESAWPQWAIDNAKVTNLNP